MSTEPSIETDLAFWREQKFIEGDASVDDVLDDSLSMRR